MSIRVFALCFVPFAAASVGPAPAATVPFTETFENDVAGWTDIASAPLAYVSTGGPDGTSYASVQTDLDLFSAEFGGVMFRGTGAGASGGAFVGDWLAGGVVKYSLSVRHNAPRPISFFARISVPANFPAAALERTEQVAPNAWTELEFAIDENNPLLTIEGFPPFTFDDIFSDVGNVQIGVSAPDFEGDLTSYTFDIDNVTITNVPEPSLLAPAAVASLGLLGAGRRNRHGQRRRSSRSGGYRSFAVSKTMR